MKPTFLKYDKPILTVMLECENAETAIGRIKKSLSIGADAFGLQIEALKNEYHHPDVYKRIFAEMQGKPVYATNYRRFYNSHKSDEELAEGILELADCGATLCDVMGDLFDKHPEELTQDEQAISKQMGLIEKLHSKGTEVLMSSHLFKFAPPQRVLEIALEQQRRGADIVKIVTAADDMEQQLENLKTTHLLRQNLKVPFLFLSGGECELHRKIGANLGCCMYLCVYEHDEHTTASQPLLQTMKKVRDSFYY